MTEQEFNDLILQMIEVFGQVPDPIHQPLQFKYYLTLLKHKNNLV